MATITGTTGNDIYQGIVGTGDVAVIDVYQDQASFLYINGVWTVTSSAGTDTLNSIESVQFLDGTFALGYGGPSTVASGASSNGDHAIARLNDGSIVSVWSALQSVDNDVFRVRYLASGERTGPQSLLSVATQLNQISPDVAALGNGNYVATWVTPDGSGNGVTGQIFLADGTRLGGEFQVNNTAITQSESLPTVESLASGGFVVSFIRPGEANTYGRIYDVNGVALGAEFRLNATAGIVALNTTLAPLSGGGFVAVYGNATSFQVQIFNSVGNFVGGPIDIGPINGPKVAAIGLSGDRFLIAAVVGTQVTYRLFDSAGVQQGPLTTVGTYGGVPFPPGNVTATALSDGGWAISWLQNDGPNGVKTHIQRFDAQGGLVGDENVPPIIFAHGVPTIVADATGGYLVEYSSGGASYYSLRYDADNLPVLPSITGDLANNVIQVNGQDGHRLVGGAGQDTLSGNIGNDILDGGDGADILTGKTGNDTYIVDGNDLIVESGAEGFDTVLTRGSYVLTAANIEQLRLLGTAAGNLTGNAENNTLYGNSADNVLDGAAGIDKLIGNAGNDTYFVDNTSDTVTERTNEGIDTVFTSVDRGLEANVENLRAMGSGNLSLFGNSLSNVIVGNAGNNFIYSASSTAVDTLEGGAGDDVYIVKDGDIIIERADGGYDMMQVRVDWVLDDNVEVLQLLSSAGSINGTGNALSNQITGNESDNVLDGGGGGEADILIGGDGGDTYLVDNSADVIGEVAANGNDTVRATVSFVLPTEVEDLVLLGRTNIDGMGNSSVNRMTGNAGDNVLNGTGVLSGVMDIVTGIGPGVDIISGNAGNDTIIAADGSRLSGGTGNDTYRVYGWDHQITEYANQGTDMVVLSVITAGFAPTVQPYNLSANVENLTVLGSDNWQVTGNNLNNTIIGNNGSNVINGASGNDAMSGGLGDDTYVVDSTGDTVIEQVAQGIDTVFSLITHTLGGNLENLTLKGGAAINGTGNTADNRIAGNSGNNTIAGLDGADVLSGGGGNDTLQGGLGDDLLLGDSGNDTLDGSTGNDTVNYRQAAAAVAVDLGVTTAQNTIGAGTDTLTGIENLAGSLFNDSLIGDLNANRLSGGAGNDALTGGAGNDTLRGDAGDDLLLGNSGDDAINGGGGNDTASYSSASAGVTVDLQNTTAQVTGEGTDTLINIENLTGSGFADTLSGDEGANIITGLGGNDVIAGGDGADTLDGGTGIDTVSYANANGAVTVNLGRLLTLNDGTGVSDTLAGFENVTGSAFDDAIRGDGGINRIEGGLGRDVLRGGAGADVFVYRSVLDSPTAASLRDVILDFTSGDRIDLSLIDANTVTAGDQAFTFIGSAAYSNVAGQLRVSTTLVEGDVNGDGISDFAITIGVPAPPVATDFVL
ncbi:beta strand repeat-containing protein [Novosphingobium cyanobacteriorum]|uniref:Calcium-binding protein n=1 Tax=Novosphingobium cyanobacteriorum TaxID=3024215 RepID=A0ABT6CFX0_9SPHN|nr:calcium-binding protein [Novosphingobium cyanobacteriorum]MDF8332686.1 calcium-binding protein [Novosphingobium cyanobacteriorum]